MDSWTVERSVGRGPYTVDDEGHGTSQKPPLGDVSSWTFVFPNL
jgi:hypothetical protein